MNQNETGCFCHMRPSLQNSELVTFGGSSLNRAGHIRPNPELIDALVPLGRILLLWRGKVLVDQTAALAWVGADCPALAFAKEPAIFLGLQDDVGYFAQDISDWTPGSESQDENQSFLDTSTMGHPDLPPDFSFQDLRSVMADLSARDAELAATAKAVLQWHHSHRYCSACGQKSHMHEAGWQRRCSTCETRHFPRTDPVVIMLVTNGNRLLLGRSPPWPQGMYSLLAGFIEPGETIEAAVRREVFEETGISTSTVRYLANQPWPFPNSLMIGCLAEATSETITVDPAELEDALWITREELVAVFAGQHPQIKGSRKGSIAHFLMTNWLADRLD